jgi:5-methylcytosine-specific restriction endonuclease McrA
MRFNDKLQRKFYQLEREKRLVEQNYRCFYCKEIIAKNEVTADHVIPIKQTKRHSDCNIVACCITCNRKKAAMTIDEFKNYNFKKVPNELKEFFEILETKTRKAEFNLDIKTHFTSFRHWQTYWQKRNKWK